MIVDSWLAVKRRADLDDIIIIIQVNQVNEVQFG